jgi:exodeoxyribonuclease VII large subunit
MTEKLSLTELQQIIRDSLYMALPDFYWVIAEISELKENYAGHCYLELIEKNPEENNVSARIKAIIWSKRYRFLKPFFENITGASLKEGQKILVKTKIEYHELYGLSLVITDIDPAFTVGEMAMKRQLVIKKLEQEGVFTMNKEIEFPILPQRIAVISSSNAAGYTDFINHLTGNSFGYVFYTALIESAMQGPETEDGVIGALNKIALNSNLFDIVVIIRGGGSQTDLSWFDNYNIAYHITQFPLPVVTGIGHDKDMSVADMVANRSMKTPTAVADFLLDCFVVVENQLTDMCTEIRDLSLSIVEKNRSKIETARIMLLPLSQVMMSDLRDKLSSKTIEIINIGKEYTYKAGLIPVNHKSRLTSAIKSFSSGKEKVVERTRENLITSTLNLLNRKIIMVDGMETNLKILKPENVLSRGYTITSMNGKIIKKKEGIKADDIIDTQFSDGVVKSRILGKNG